VAFTSLWASLCLADVRVDGNVFYGWEYDDNASVDELDNSRGSSDQVMNAGASVKLEYDLTQSTEMSASVSHTNSQYASFERLDRETTSFSGNIAQELGTVSLSANYFFINAKLDGQDFLSYQRFSPAISTFLGKKWFVRLAYVAGEKDFARRRGRSASLQGAEFDTYFFFHGLRQYFNLGIATRREDSLAANYDYQSTTAKLRWVNRFDLFGRPAKSEVGVKFEDRDYASKSWGTREPRQDRRLRTSASLGVEIVEHVTMELYLGLNDFSSNLSMADYDQQVTGLKLVYDF